MNKSSLSQLSNFQLFDAIKQGDAIMKGFLDRHNKSFNPQLVPGVQKVQSKFYQELRIRLDSIYQLNIEGE